jgi:hypothetical protein
MRFREAAPGARGQVTPGGRSHGPVVMPTRGGGSGARLGVDAATNVPSRARQGPGPGLSTLGCSCSATKAVFGVP